MLCKLYIKYRKTVEIIYFSLWNFTRKHCETLFAYDVREIICYCICVLHVNRKYKVLQSVIIITVAVQHD